MITTANRSTLAPNDQTLTNGIKVWEWHGYLLKRISYIPHSQQTYYHQARVNSRGSTEQQPSPVASLHRLPAGLYLK